MFSILPIRHINDTTLASRRVDENVISKVYIWNAAIYLIFLDIYSQGYPVNRQFCRHYILMSSEHFGRAFSLSEP